VISKRSALLHLLFFFCLTYILSWSIWLWGLPRSGWFLVLGTFAPTLIALLLTAIYDGRKGLAKILQVMIRWRVKAWWYLFCFGSTALVVGVSLVWYSLNDGQITHTNDPRQWYLIFPAFLQVLFFSVLGEEIGWRGFALPQMQKMIGALPASMVLGIIWSLWHLPLFWQADNFHSQLPISLFLLQSIALTILITWLYNRTGGSLLMVHLFHTASNLTLGVLPIMPENTGGDLAPLWMAVVLLWLMTLVVLLLTKGKLGFDHRSCRG